MSEDYQRGVRDGEIRARLDDHTRRLDVVNGSIALTGERLLQLTEAVTRLTEVAHASEERAEKYVPMIERLEQSRILGVKRWQVGAAFAAVVVPPVLALFHNQLGV